MYVKLKSAWPIGKEKKKGGKNRLLTFKQGLGEEWRKQKEDSGG